PLLLFIICWRTATAGDTLRFVPELVPGLQQIYHIPWSDIKHPRVGLALSGGGARGLAHIGVLQVLEEAGIEVDVIAGTSMGALVGGMYASGYKPDEIQQRLTALNWQEYYFDSAERRSMFPGIRETVSGHLFQIRFRNFVPYIPMAVPSGQRFLTTLLKLNKRGIYQNYKSWDLLRVSFRCVTTDLVTGKRVVFSRGDLSEAIRASMSIPLLLAPVVWDSLLLVDGGLVENIPVETARAAGADFVIAVDVTAGMRNATELRHPWEVIDQISNFTITPRNNELLQQADLVITPATSAWGSSDYTRMEEIIQLGRKATLGLLDSLRCSIKQLTVGIDTVLQVDTLLYSGALVTRPPLEPSGAGAITRSRIMQLLYEIHQTGFYTREEAQLYTDHQGRRTLEFVLQENRAVTGLHVYGLPTVDSMAVIESYQPFLGQPANFLEGLHLLDKSIARLRQSGFSLAGIDSLHFDTGIISLWIDRGQIDTVTVTGNLQTSDYSILRDFKIKPGDYFNLFRAQSSIANIYGSDLYRSAYFRIHQKGGGKTLELMVTERPFPLLQVGLGYDNRCYERIFLRLRHENTAGLAIRTVLYWRFSSEREQQMLRLEQDRLFHTTLTWRIEAENKYDQYSLWDGDNKSDRASYRALDLNAFVGQQIRRLGTISAGIRLTKGKYRQNGTIRSFDLRRLVLSSLVDTRNRVPWPESGEYHLVEFETSSSLLNPSESFNRWWMLFESWRNLNQNHIFHSTIYLAQADETTPEPYWLHQGYETGLPAYHTRQFRGRLAARLGLQYCWTVTRTEPHRLLLMAQLQGVGNWPSNDSRIELPTDLHPHLSAGLILDSLLGPMELIYAFAPPHNGLDGSQRLMLNVGFHF
ncbi:patatin-like phospholipase family protein, partial [bacterium]|nr:patatin-like phospholipase family protein [bacterium]